MSFLSPIWLIGLAPWAGLTLWLLWGRRPRVMVPFVALWQISAVDVRAKRNMQTPPVAVALIVLSLLLALFAASNPLLRISGSRSEIPVVVLLDRGASMSARARDGSHFRFQQAVRNLAAQLVAAGGPSLPIRLVDLGDGSTSDLRTDQLVATVDARLPTLIDTGNAVRSAMLQVAHVPDTPAFVVTDQSIGVGTDHFIRIVPTDSVRNVAIVQLVVRRTPVNQLMVRVRNDGIAIKPATLRVSSGTWQKTVPITLPPPGSERDYFVDAEHLGDVTRADLVGVDDDVPADDHRAVAREGEWARIDPRMPLPPAMNRLLDSYRAHRPATANSSTVPIVAKVAALPDNAAGLVLEYSDAVVTSDAPLGAITTEPHPLLQSVDFRSFPKTAAIASDAPDWTPIVRAGERTLVAIRETPARQIWVGFDPSSWAGSPDFVVFFSSCLDWLSAGGVVDRSYPLSELTKGWHRVDEPDSQSPSFAGPIPGVYRQPNQALRAFALPHVHFDVANQTVPPSEIARLVNLRRPGIRLGTGLLDAALLCLVAAALTWRRRRSIAELLPGHDLSSETDAAVLATKR